MPNQNPEQIARDQIDKQLTACGCTIQSVRKVNLHVGIGVAVKGFLTDIGLADNVLFVIGLSPHKSLNSFDPYCRHCRNSASQPSNQSFVKEYTQMENYTYIRILNFE